MSPTRPLKRAAPQDATKAVGVVRLPAHSHLVSMLRALIIEGEIVRDDQLSERVLCERFQVSRAPMREAIRAAAAEGLLEIVPNCGARLVQVDRQQLADLSQLIAVLEIAASQQACEKASDAQIARIGELHFRMVRYYALADWSNYFATNAEIHYEIIDAAGNAVLSETYRRLDMRLRPFRYQFHFLAEADDSWEMSFKRSLDDHVKIFEAISRRDKAEIAKVIDQHYDIKDLYLDYWDRSQLTQDSVNSAASSLSSDALGSKMD